MGPGRVAGPSPRSRTLRAVLRAAAMTPTSHVTEPALLGAKARPLTPGTGGSMRGGRFTQVSEHRRQVLDERAAGMRRAPTTSEARLFEAVRGRRLGVGFRRQVPLLGRFIADLFAPEVRLVVEVDGGVHDGRAAADERRDRALAGAGYRVVRVGIASRPSRPTAPFGLPTSRTGSARRFSGRESVSPSTQGASPLLQGVPASGQDASPVAQGGSRAWKTRGCGSCDRGPCAVQGGSRGPTGRVRVARDPGRAAM